MQIMIATESGSSAFALVMLASPDRLLQTLLQERRKKGKRGKLKGGGAASLSGQDIALTELFTQAVTLSVSWWVRKSACKLLRPANPPDPPPSSGQPYLGRHSRRCMLDMSVASYLLLYHQILCCIIWSQQQLLAMKPAPQGAASNSQAMLAVGSNISPPRSLTNPLRPTCPPHDLLQPSDDPACSPSSHKICPK